MSHFWDALELKRVRSKFGLSQSDFAVLFGLSGPKAVSNIETGFRNPNKTIVLWLSLLDSLPEIEARALIGKVFRQAKRQDLKKPKVKARDL